MASLGKLTNAFLQATQETTLTLANLNFNFALIKFDAPEEYQGLGDSLSTRRKIAAEDGSLHVTARKLAALFQSTIPCVPKLIQAYGVRSSEIAKQPKVNPGAHDRQGIFADFVGADGTSIWASATSGTDAVTIHLLACMLARIWKREQSIPIWTELVEQRKAFLQASITGADGPFHVSDLAASRIDLSRSDLDEWDSSATDAGQELRQTQLRLITDNISLPVSTNSNLYSAIKDAWISAMKGLDSLIKGEPQRIDNGAILLGLSAWHLYPNILLANTNQHVKQSDPLIDPGGIITIGLQNKVQDDKGIVWSLPLTQARFYGEPIVATRHAGLRESQIPFKDSMLVVVGSVLGSWQPMELDVDVALDLIKTIFNAVKSLDPIADAQETGGDKPDNPLRNVEGEDWVLWLSLLAKSADHFARASGLDRQNLIRLVRYGQRNCSKFLSPRKFQPPPAFGLTDFSKLLTPTRGSSEARAVFLRNWAARELDPDVAPHAVVRYRENSYARYFYTNVVKEKHAKKRQRLGQSSNHHVNSEIDLRWTDTDDLADASWVSGNDPTTDSEISAYTANIPSTSTDKPTSHTFVCGIRDLAAIYVPSYLATKSTVQNNSMSVSQLKRCIEEGDLDYSQIAYALEEVANCSASSPVGAYFDSLCAVQAASTIYSKLPGARVNLQAMSLRVSKSRWWQAMRARPVTVQTVMSCVAYFETGGLDIDPDDLGVHTFAVCHASSIFVASRMLGDPADDTLDTSVERIIGNVGRPGLSFLVTPPDPRRQRFDPASWHLIAHETYNWEPQNSFSATSFHLSFTGYELPLAGGERSGRDVPAHLLETAVAVYDKDGWVADLDVLEASKRWRIAPDLRCHHQTSPHRVPSNVSAVSIDSWLEILDPPEPGQYAVVRAHGNPIARLATAALGLQMGWGVVILPGQSCFGCHVQGGTFPQGPSTPSDSSCSDTDMFGNPIEKMNSPNILHDPHDEGGMGTFEVGFSDDSKSEDSLQGTIDAEGESSTAGSDLAGNTDRGLFIIQ